MNLAQLNEHFAIPGVLSFDKHNGLVRANVTSPAASATIYLQGAHITHWQPTGQQPALFLSRKSDFVPGKPIRGGVPIAFPWFATDSNPNRYQGKPGPSHGFARIQDWTLAFAALSGDDLHLTFTLGPSDLSREMGFDGFKLAFQLTIGPSLTMALTVANESDKPLHFEEALHTYFAVVDVHEATVTGLGPTPFIDKTDNFRVKPAANAPFTPTAFTDRIYENTTATCVIRDVPGRRSITVAKTNSNTTVVFNPWKEMADMGPDEWHEMLCVETVNAAANAITLAPGTTHTMQAHITIQKAG
ncbi:D-hexose-6-phosphate mutarotase [Edaphobacter bradus]|uniref:D-hexose-6-phosphate mutarotase n=1 Tax=Edaphobacter bradus TaxID=2259016 RepID=UPI0021DF896A|nr:D-hexose-6-phosphate mutarotase [Edaphobacter bradus]